MPGLDALGPLDVSAIDRVAADQFFAAALFERHGVIANHGKSRPAGPDRAAPYELGRMRLPISRQLRPCERRIAAGSQKLGEISGRGRQQIDLGHIDTCRDRRKRLIGLDLPSPAKRRNQAAVDLIDLERQRGSGDREDEHDQRHHSRRARIGAAPGKPDQERQCGDESQVQRHDVADRRVQRRYFQPLANRNDSQAADRHHHPDANRRQAPPGRCSAPAFARVAARGGVWRERTTGRAFLRSLTGGQRFRHTRNSLLEKAERPRLWSRAVFSPR